MTIKMDDRLMSQMHNMLLTTCKCIGHCNPIMGKKWHFKPGAKEQSLSYCNLVMQRREGRGVQEAYKER